jgi:hypothetical protein
VRFVHSTSGAMAEADKFYTAGALTVAEYEREFFRHLCSAGWTISWFERISESFGGGLRIPIRRREMRHRHLRIATPHAEQVNAVLEVRGWLLSLTTSAFEYVFGWMCTTSTWHFFLVDCCIACIIHCVIR